MRLPVAAKIALHSAGANGGKPGSPTPLDGTSIAAGNDVDMRDRAATRRCGATWKPSKLFCCDAPVLEADLAILGEAEPHHRRAFDLRADALGVGGKAAIDRSIDARHREVAFLVDRDLDDGRDIAEEAAVHGDAQAVARRQLACPTPPFSATSSTTRAQPRRCRSDRSRTDRRNSCSRLAAAICADRRCAAARSARAACPWGRAPPRAASSATKDCIAKACGMLRHRAEPADARMRFGLADLAAQVRDRKRHVDDAHG